MTLTRKDRLHERAASNKPRATKTLLLGVEFDNELFVDSLGDIATLRIADEFTSETGAVPFEPCIVVGTRGEIVGDNLQRLGTLADGNDVTNFQFIRGNIDHIAVDGDVAVGHELTCLGPAAGDAETIDNIVQT